MDTSPDAPDKDVSLGSDYKDAKRERRRAEILDAAATVFADKGYFAATMQDVANVLGMRSASLYYYFDSKEAALEEVCRRGGQEFVQQLRTLMATDRPAIEIIEDGIRNHLDSRWRDHVASFVFNRQNLPEGVLAEMDGIARDYLALWTKVLQRGQRRNEIAAALDTRVAAGAILAICNNLAVSGNSEKKRGQASVQTVLAIILDGIRKPG
jgi:TetR/AcrR family transcriptional regulator, cholesterol catabolism regulator